MAEPASLEALADNVEPPPGVRLSGAERTSGRRFLWGAVACAGFALAIQMGVNANFLADDIGINGFQMGLLEAVRESCGIFALGALALLAGMAEPVVGAIMLLVFAVGIGAYTFAPGYFTVMAMSVVWSQGLHVWMPLPHSMALALSEPDRTGYRLGQVSAAGAAGFGAGLAVAWVLSLLGTPIRPMYLVAASLGVAAACFCYRVPHGIATERPRLVFRKRYRTYYLLCFLEGWRKQIFVCFAGYLLVREYGADLKVILGLFFCVQLIGCVTSPRVGKLIDRIGERPTLMGYFLCLALFFAGYAFIRNRILLYILFVVDNAFFVFAMALNTYVNRLAPRHERTPTLSMGVAMNHVAAVAMPFIGGILWQAFGYQAAFLTGTVAALISVGVAATLPTREALAAA